MNLSFKDVLADKKGGIGESLGLVMVVLTLLLAAGSMVANYAILSKQAAELQNLTAEVTNRAEAYASDLNSDFLAVIEPSTARECSTITAMCTQIISVTPGDAGATRVLRIQGDTVGLLGQTLTTDVTLLANEVTHVTAIDGDGNNVWALSDEGLRYKTWGVAEGKPKTISDEELTGPETDVKWVSIDDRAGIDSTGALWAWGKNNIGQAGIGKITATAEKPQRVTPAGVSFRSVVTDDDRAYAIDSSGYAWVWGKNTKGQLGLGHANAVTKPTKITGTRFLTFAIGKDNVFALTMSGELMTVGASATGFPANTGFQWQHLNAATTYRAIAASQDGAVALIDEAGRFRMVGNSYPFPEVASGTYTSVSLGTGFGYAIGGTGNLYSFGNGANGQLGLGAATSAALPTNTATGTLFTSVTAGKTGAFAIDASGSLHYVGKAPAGFPGGKDLPQVNVLTKILSGITFRQTTLNSGDSVAAFLDGSANLYGFGTTTAGLWPMNYLGSGDQPIRMPVPDDFNSYTW